MSLYTSVLAGLRELEPIDARDQACADLALAYAKGIDDPAEWIDKQRDPLAELGSKLLACLQQLQMTPAARKAVMGAAPASTGNPLDELKRKRAERGA